MTNEEVMKCLGFLKQDEDFLYPHNQELNLIIKQSCDWFGKIKLKLSYNLNNIYKEETRKIYNNINYFKHYLCEKVHEIKSIDFLTMNDWINNSVYNTKEDLTKYHYIKKFGELQIDIIFYGIDYLKTGSISNLGMKFNVFFKHAKKLIWKTTIPKSFDLLKIVSNPNNYAFSHDLVSNVSVKDFINIGFKQKSQNIYDSIQLNQDNQLSNYLERNIKSNYADSEFTYQMNLHSENYNKAIIIDAYDCNYKIEGLHNHCYKPFITGFDRFLIDAL